MTLEGRFKRIADWRAGHVWESEVRHMAEAILLAVEMHATPEQYTRVKAEFDKLLGEAFPVTR